MRSVVMAQGHQPIGLITVLRGRLVEGRLDLAQIRKIALALLAVVANELLACLGGDAIAKAQLEK